MEFNKKKHIEKMKPHADKMLVHLKNKGIDFSPEDVDGFENVTFTSKDKVIKMSKHSFYRFSGIACFYKEGKEKNSSEAFDFTDEMYMNIIIKPIVEGFFKVK